MNIIDVKNKMNSIKNNILAKPVEIENKKKKISNLNKNIIQTTQKKKLKLKKNINKFFLNRTGTELKVLKFKFYKYLKFVVKQEKNYLPNKLYIYYNKSPNNILYSLLFPYVLYLLFSNTNYIINVNKYWDEVKRQYDIIKKKDLDFNPKLMYQSRELYETGYLRRIIYFGIFFWTITLTVFLYVIMHTIMESLCINIIDSDSYIIIRAVLTIIFIILGFIFHYYLIPITIVTLRIFFWTMYYILYLVIMIIIVLFRIVIYLIFGLYNTLKSINQTSDEKKYLENESNIFDRFKNLLLFKSESTKSENDLNIFDRFKNLLSFKSESTKSESKFSIFDKYKEMLLFKAKKESDDSNYDTNILNKFKEILLFNSNSKSVKSDSNISDLLTNFSLSKFIDNKKQQYFNPTLVDVKLDKIKSDKKYNNSFKLDNIKGIKNTADSLSNLSFSNLVNYKEIENKTDKTIEEENKNKKIRIRDGCKTNMIEDFFLQFKKTRIDNDKSFNTCFKNKIYEKNKKIFDNCKKEEIIYPEIKRKNEFEIQEFNQNIEKKETKKCITTKILTPILKDYFYILNKSINGNKEAMSKWYEKLKEEHENSMNNKSIPKELTKFEKYVFIGDDYLNQTYISIINILNKDNLNATYSEITKLENELKNTVKKNMHDEKTKKDIANIFDLAINKFIYGNKYALDEPKNLILKLIYKRIELGFNNNGKKGARFQIEFLKNEFKNRNFINKLYYEKIKKNKNQNEKLSPIIQKYIYFTMKHIQGDIQKFTIWLENLYLKHKETFKNNKQNLNPIIKFYLKELIKSIETNYKNNFFINLEKEHYNTFKKNKKKLTPIIETFLALVIKLTKTGNIDIITKWTNNLKKEHKETFIKNKKKLTPIIETFFKLLFRLVKTKSKALDKWMNNLEKEHKETFKKNKKKLTPIIETYFELIIKLIKTNKDDLKKTNKNDLLKWMNNLEKEHKKTFNKNINENNIYKLTNYEKFLYFGEEIQLGFILLINMSNNSIKDKISDVMKIKRKLEYTNKLNTRTIINNKAINKILDAYEDEYVNNKKGIINTLHKNKEIKTNTNELTFKCLTYRLNNTNKKYIKSHIKFLRKEINNYNFININNNKDINENNIYKLTNYEKFLYFGEEIQLGLLLYIGMSNDSVKDKISKLMKIKKDFEYTTKLNIRTINNNKAINKILDAYEDEYINNKKGIIDTLDKNIEIKTNTNKSTFKCLTYRLNNTDKKNIKSHIKFLRKEINNYNFVNINNNKDINENNIYKFTKYEKFLYSGVNVIMTKDDKESRILEIMKYKKDLEYATKLNERSNNSNKIINKILDAYEDAYVNNIDDKINLLYKDEKIKNTEIFKTLDYRLNNTDKNYIKFHIKYLRNELNNYNFINIDNNKKNNDNNKKNNENNIYKLTKYEKLIYLGEDYLIKNGFEISNIVDKNGIEAGKKKIMEIEEELKNTKKLNMHTDTYKKYLNIILNAYEDKYLNNKQDAINILNKDVNVNSSLTFKIMTYRLNNTNEKYIESHIKYLRKQLNSYNFIKQTDNNENNNNENNNNRNNNKNNIYKFTEFEKLIYFGESYLIEFGNTINNILEKHGLEAAISEIIKTEKELKNIRNLNMRSNYDNEIINKVLNAYIDEYIYNKKGVIKILYKDEDIINTRTFQSLNYRLKNIDEKYLESYISFLKNELNNYNFIRIKLNMILYNALKGYLKSLHNEYVIGKKNASLNYVLKLSEYLKDIQDKNNLVMPLNKLTEFEEMIFIAGQDSLDTIKNIIIKESKKGPKAVDIKIKDLEIYLKNNNNKRMFSSKVIEMFTLLLNLCINEYINNNKGIINETLNTNQYFNYYMSSHIETMIIFARIKKAYQLKGKTGANVQIELFKKLLNINGSNNIIKEKKNDSNIIKVIKEFLEMLKIEFIIGNKKLSTEFKNNLIKEYNILIKKNNISKILSKHEIIIFYIGSNRLERIFKRIKKVSNKEVKYISKEINIIKHELLKTNKMSNEDIKIKNFIKKVLNSLIDEYVNKLRGSLNMVYTNNLNYINIPEINLIITRVEKAYKIDGQKGALEQINLLKEINKIN